MRRKWLWGVWALAAGVVLAAGVPGPEPVAKPPEIRETETVTATGKSGLQGDIARDEAIRDALRTAVEQAAGVFINAQSQAENFQLVKDVILSRARGFVRSYEILEDKRNDDGEYVVKVRAVVVTKEVADSWLDVRGILVEKGMPRMMVHIAEFVDGGKSNFNTAQAKVENYLLKFGFPLIDQAQVKENDRRDIEAARLADDLNQIATISARYKADMVIVGKSNATVTRPPYNLQPFFYTSVVEMRSVRTANAKLLFSESLSGKERHPNKEEAARLALAAAGDSIGREFKTQIIDFWIKELSKQVGTDYEIEISGIKFLQKTALEKELKANPKMITHVNTKDYRNNIALLVVGCTTSTDNLAEWMATTLKSVKLEVTEVTPGAIKAKVAGGE